MKPFYQILAPRAFSLIFAASVTGLAACSTGTGDGETNVEVGGMKDRDPTEHNQSGQNTSPNVKNHYDSLEALQDTARVKDDAYERVRKENMSHTDGRQGN